MNDRSYNLLSACHGNTILLSEFLLENCKGEVAEKNIFFSEVRVEARGHLFQRFVGQGA